MTTLPTSSSLPATLCEHDQWVCWREQSRGENGKPTKVPINPKTGRYASATDPDTWTTFEEARMYALDKSVEGLGFVFSDDDPFVGVDLDDARNPETEDPDARAAAIIDTLDSYTEVSPSGTGYHVIINGELPPGRNRRGTVECYETDRFFTVTGKHVDSSPKTILERKEALYDVYRRHVADNEQVPDEDETTASPEHTDDTISLADDDLLSRARAADNGEKFAQLFEGNIQGYDSHSEADMALACLLAFWTGGDTAQMDRLFRRSGLLREKWDDVHYADGQTYGETTLSRAVSVTSEYYAPQSGRETHYPSMSDERSVVEPIADEESIQTERSLRERERARIETITRLEQRLRELEAENERLRTELAEERDAHVQKAAIEDQSMTRNGGLIHHLKQVFR